MRGLTLRLAVPVAAVVLVGLAVVDVAFLFWAQNQLNHHRPVELEAAALATALALTAPTGLSQQELVALADEHDVELTLVGPTGERLSSVRPPRVLPELPGSGRVVAGGVELVAVAAPRGTAWTRVVAARPVDLGEALAWQRPALLFLLAVAVLMVALALLFLRRAVVSPVERMTQLVGAADRDGLSRFGLEASESFARLSSAIVGMTQRIDDDRVRFAEQLERLRAAHAELNATQQRLVRAERLAVVGQLAAGLAHEIGNPLAVLSGYLDVLEDAELSLEERADAVLHMGRELERINVIMRDLLDFSRAPREAAGAGDAREALRHVVKLLRPQERFRDVELRVTLPEQSSEVPLETNALTQVLLNLLFNAADALGGNGTVSVFTEAGDGRLSILVDDDGPGVAEDVASTVFEPFFTTKSADGGTGLGLAVCDHIVSSVGGEITVERSDLGGARFRVTLPVATSPTRSGCR